MQCMANLVHCRDRGMAAKLHSYFPVNRTATSSSAQISSPLDRSTQACVPKRLLAQKLVESQAACRAVLAALDSNQANREAALAVLLHCCGFNVQLAIQCNKQGLIQQLLKLLQGTSMQELCKVRTLFVLRLLGFFQTYPP